MDELIIEAVDFDDPQKEQQMMIIYLKDFSEIMVDINLN